MCPCCTYLEHSARGGAGSTCLDTKQACGPHPTESPRNTCCTIIPHLSTRILCIVSFPHTYSRASQVSWDVSSLWYIRGRRQQPDSARGDYAWLRTLSSHTCTATTTFRLVKGDFGVEDPLRGLRAVVCPEYSGVVVSWAWRRWHSSPSNLQSFHPTSSSRRWIRGTSPCVALHHWNAAAHLHTHTHKAATAVRAGQSGVRWHRTREHASVDPADPCGAHTRARARKEQALRTAKKCCVTLALLWKVVIAKLRVLLERSPLRKDLKLAKSRSLKRSLGIFSKSHTHHTHTKIKMYV